MRIVLFLVAFLCASAGHASASPLASHGSSLLDYFFEAQMVAVCNVRNSVKPNNALPNGQTDMVLREMLVPHAILMGRKIVRRDWQMAPGKYLVAMEIYKGNIDAYKVEPVDPEGELVRYVRGAFQIKDKSPFGRAQYAADFLHSPCQEVAASAFAGVCGLSQDRREDATRYPLESPAHG